MTASQATPAQPAATLLEGLRGELCRFVPFAQMESDAVDAFIVRASLRYHAAGDVLLHAGETPAELFLVREGAVSGSAPSQDGGVAPVHCEPGDLFPLAEASAGTPVPLTYTSTGDTFVLAVPAAVVRDLAARSAAFGAFVAARVGQYLQLSRTVLRERLASRVLAEHGLERPVGELVAREPVSCAPGTPLRDALERMRAGAVGSVVVCEPGGRVAGIFTRHDLLERVALAQVPLDTPMAELASRPVRTLDWSASAGEAALLMAREGVRHVPVLRDGRLSGVVSERDLFALQRLSLHVVGSAIRLARDAPGLQAAAGEVRALARALLAQGVQPAQLTLFISRLNDLVTQAAVRIQAGEHGVDLRRLCWLALGSEGRAEQTVATDQDNALVLADDAGPDEREKALRFAASVNRLLDACGYPLCRGGIMAGEPGCCARLQDWHERFAAWIAHGSPEDLLHASIFFDLRPLAGDRAFGDSLQASVVAQAARTPRFLKQLAVQALERSPALNWLGALQADAAGCVDLKLQGTAVFVDAARIYALGQGLLATGTAERLRAVAAAGVFPAAEAQAWVAAFEFLQALRLRVQVEAAAGPPHANGVRVADLHDVDRRMLKESLRMARQLQQRLRLDYER